MQKVIAFVGSPRRLGNTAALVEEAARGVRDAGGTVQVYYLEELQIGACQGCLTCRQKPECKQQDDLSPIYEEIRTADAIIIGSPIYMWQVSSQVKKLLDRFYVLVGPDLKPRYSPKKTLMIYSQAHANANCFATYYNYTANMMKRLFGLEVVDNLVVPGALSQDMARSNPTLMVGAYLAGRNLIG